MVLNMSKAGRPKAEIKKEKVYNYILTNTLIRKIKKIEVKLKLLIIR